MTSIEQARAECLSMLVTLGAMGSADPEGTGRLATKAIERFLAEAGEQDVLAAWKLVARYY